MGTNSSVRITNSGDLERMLTIYADGLPQAVEAGVEAAVQYGAEVMAAKLDHEVTFTGSRTHPGHPGRNRSGELRYSIYDGAIGSGEATDAYRIKYNRNGNLSVDFGILDPPDIQGALAQEFGTGNKGGAIAGGGSGGIQGMMIVQAGFNAVAVRINDELAKELARLGRSAEAKRAYARSKAARNRANPNVRD